MHLLEVKTSHFKECDDDFSISFMPQAPKYEDDLEFEVNEIDEDLFVFSTMGILGKNASGKTTVVEILGTVYDIFSRFQVEISKPFFDFVENTVHFDVLFYHDKAIYRYVFDLVKTSDITTTRILFDNQHLYKRNYKKTHARNLYDFDKYEEITFNALPPNTSILYNIFKTPMAKGLFCLSNDLMYSNIPHYFEMAKNLGIKSDTLSAIIRLFDEHISNIESIDKEKFRIYYSNKKVKDIPKDDLNEILSSGSVKGFGLLIFVVCSLDLGIDLVIDEIETHFHKTLVENIINLYKDKAVNKKGATLVFTTHYGEILDLFSRYDNIWITKYDEKIRLENVYKVYQPRSDILKSKQFYGDAFKTNVDYERLMDFKRALM